jgi:hypothetical protein
LQHIQIIQRLTKTHKVLAFATSHAYYLAMKKRYICLTLVLALSILSAPLAVAGVPPPPPAPVLITEVQPGTAASASQEFIEIYNASSTSINLTAGQWQLQIASSTATSWESPLRTIPLTGVLEAGQSLVAVAQYSSNKVLTQYLPAIARASYSPAISAAAGHIRVAYMAKDADSQNACVDTLRTVDQVEWSGMKSGTFAAPSWGGRTPYTVLSPGGIDATQSLQRTMVASTRYFADTDDDTADFALAAPTPGAVPMVLANTATLSPDTCGAAVDPPDEPSEPPSPPADPGSGGEPDPGPGPSPDDPGDSPPVQPNSGLVAPTITELLPNPASPQTDSADEFIELYNSNTAPFAIGGFALEVGTTTKHRYVFPAGTQLAAGNWTAFFSRDTGLSLSNAGGAARLLDGTGVVVAAADPYGTAAEGQAWIYETGMWQWSTTPTPGAANIASVLPAILKNAVTAGTAAKKTAAVKAATTTKAPKQAATKTTKSLKQSKPKEAAMVPVAANTRRPLHAGVLATVGAFALLYGTYEYRSDITNKFHQFRRYRADRRKGRPRAEGR